VVLGLIKLREIRGKYLNAVIYSSRKNRALLIEGKVKCPFTDKEFDLRIKPHEDQATPGYIEDMGGFVNHVFSTKGYEAWLRERIEHYSRNSFHRVKVFVCAKCSFKSRRFPDTLIHLIMNHGFLARLP